MKNLELQKCILGPVYTNCYFLKNKTTGEMIVIDPADFPEKIYEKVIQMGGKPAAILLTHGHFDHIMGIDGFLDAFPVPVYVHEKEQLLLNDAEYNCSANYGKGYTFSKAVSVQDGDILEIAGMKIRVIYTPGHTIGGCCYYLEAEHVLFSGDTLFCTSVGRTDLPTGSTSRLLRSVREKLMVLPDETKVYPGHEEETTIGYEREYNPYLR